MSVLISGALTDGAGIPMSGCHIILKSRVNTSEVVTRTIADVVTGNNGEYSFEAQTGKYCVYLKQDWRDEYCVGDIAVYDDSKPGTLNDFLTAPDEGDLKPDVVKRFEELVAQAQQSAEAAAGSEQQAGQYAADVQQNAEAVAEDKKQVALLASSAAQDAARAEQAEADADKIVRKAVDNLSSAALIAGNVRADANAAEQHAREAAACRDTAQQMVGNLNASHATTTEKGLVQLCSDTDRDSEELAATPKAVKAVMDEVKTKAPLDSPAFTGTPTTPTPPDDATGLEMANAAFVRKLIAALVGSSPEALDTLNELSAALGNDPDFAVTMTKALAGKQPLNDVLTAISNLSELAGKALYFDTDGNARLTTLTDTARTLLGKAIPGDMRDVLELKNAATKDVQTNIYDDTPGRLALPGAFGYGMMSAGCGVSIIADDLKHVALAAHSMKPSRYYTFSTVTEDTTGLTEILWLDNYWGDKTIQTATKLVMFYAADGRILATIRGADRSAPVEWVNLTPHLGTAAALDAQTDIRDNTPGRLALTGSGGFGKLFTEEDVLTFDTLSDFVEWATTAVPGRYAVRGCVRNDNSDDSGVIELLQTDVNHPETRIAKFYCRNGYSSYEYYCQLTISSSGKPSFAKSWTQANDVTYQDVVRMLNNKPGSDSPVFTGTPKTPTPPLTSNDTQIANTAFVRQLFTYMVDSAPESLSTLNELSKALNDDPDFAANITNMLAGKQPLNDTLTALSDLTPTVNTFPYFGANGELALAELSGRAKSLLGIGSYEKMRALMGLGGAATLEPQADIYDRTEGKLALPGAFGFGREFTTEDSQAFQNVSDFSEWLKKVEPGRYAVSIADTSNLLQGTTSFNGIIDVMWAPFDNNAADVALKFKNMVCYNQFRDGAHSMHYVRYMFSGNNWNARVNYIVYDGASLAHLLGNMTGTEPNNYYQYPDIGVPILASYQGESFGADTTLGLGDIVPGSRLSCVVISSSVNDSGPYASTPRVVVGAASKSNFPGRYKALSGSRFSSGTEIGYIGLFVRIE
ncbi:prophage tail fiber N-terminal domain-containing protein [Escherichia coli]|uniref:prophage tail fiber N-terminal domain-containing protein n=1 Tax=Escherichia coli TaxID=562 RepID=UPI0038B37AD4